MLQQNHPEDFVIATGKTVTLEFSIEIEHALQFFGLNYKDYLVSIRTGIAQSVSISDRRTFLKLTYY